MTGFDAVVRVARLALQSSGEGVETLERYVARAASAYGIAVDVDVVTLPEEILIRDKASESVSNLAVVRATPGIFRLDQLAALKECWWKSSAAWMQTRHAASLMRSRRRRSWIRSGAATLYSSIGGSMP